MNDQHFKVEAIECFPLTAPVEKPVRNSWRTLTSRSALVVRLVAADGAYGWGEVWCNYPPRAAHHRARLIDDVVAPLLVGREFEGPAHLSRLLEQALRIPAIQSGEPGPFAQVAAGLDNAAWDLVARRAGEPLWRYLGGVARVKVYASGLSPDDPEPLAERAVRQGFTAAKLKVGTDPALDRRNARAVLDALGGGTLMLDANQRWKPDQAAQAIEAFAEYSPLWMEEPIPADEPIAAWQALARSTRMPLAAGENLRGASLFDDYLASGAVRYIQPDIGKWGGYSACVSLARRAAEAGVEFCPHWLGGAVGLMASLQVLGGTGGHGWGEFDANPNLLREAFMPEGLAVAGGYVELSAAPGIGCDPDPVALRQFAAARE
jgi:D-galactarolactone cycloisomerase